MAAVDEDIDTRPRKRRLLPQKRRWRALLLVLSLVGLAFIWAWMSREQIAGNLIETELQRLGLPASYEVVSVGPQQQRLRNLVIGDANAPDLTIEEVVVNLEYGLAGPYIDNVEVIRPRLFGSFIDDTLSFGSLDPVLFAESDEPAGLPALDLAIRDGRGLIETGYGPIGLKIEGEGPLNDGFAGKLAATAPGIGVTQCRAQGATLYGDVITTGGTASFTGPIRARDLSCESIRLEKADIGAQVQLSPDFSQVEGDVQLSASDAAIAGNTMRGLNGNARFSYGEGGLTLTHDLQATRIATHYGALETLGIDGSLAGNADFEKVEWDGNFSGAGARLLAESSAELARLAGSAEGTLLAPLLQKFDRNVQAALANGALSGRAIVRSEGERLSVIIPEGRINSANGDTVLALSRVNWTSGNGATETSGNFMTGGAGLPQINGRMEQSAGGSPALRLTMAPYIAGESALALPRMQAVQGRNGAWSFAGTIAATGAIPGGSVRALELPLEGVWRPSGTLRIGSSCSVIRFASLNLAQLTLDKQQIELCPEQGRSIISYDEGLQIAARTGEIVLSGELAGSPAGLAASSATLRYPGAFALENVQAVIGEQGTAVRLSAGELSGAMGAAPGGTLTGGSAALDLVPLDLSEMSGRWNYGADGLVIEQGEFLLTERIAGTDIQEQRFEPLLARDAKLTLAGANLIAKAGLLHPASGRLVTRVDIRHDLSAGEGGAAIDVPGVVFDDALQPDQLSYLADGVVELAKGSVTGSGRIDWSGDTITSSGVFGTDGIDFAAAFGPVRGASGQIEFTDLINLTTAPDQIIRLAAINPGVEVLSGEVRYSMTNGTLIEVGGARWPFMDGELILRPVTIDYGTPGSQRYVFEMVGLDAATFVAQMELGNVGATGTFDGTVPIAFDDAGNGTIEGGLLISRPPGGNVSYIGELTYEDLGAIGDFAFQSLRSLDYNQMSVALSGSLSGEIITSFQIDGVRQGAQASRNFLTRRLAKLPIRFRINVRSENFFQLATIARIYLDPTAARDPRALGLFEFENGRLVPSNNQQPEATDPVDQPDDSPPDPGEPLQNRIEAVQNRESEPVP